jgi:hypothetical protein
MAESAVQVGNRDRLPQQTDTERSRQLTRSAATQPELHEGPACEIPNAYVWRTSVQDSERVGRAGGHGNDSVEELGARARFTAEFRDEFEGR